MGRTFGAGAYAPSCSFDDALHVELRGAVVAVDLVHLDLSMIVFLLYKLFVVVNTESQVFSHRIYTLPIL